MPALPLRQRRERLSRQEVWRDCFNPPNLGVAHDYLDHRRLIRASERTLARREDGQGVALAVADRLGADQADAREDVTFDVHRFDPFAGQPGRSAG